MYRFTSKYVLYYDGKAHIFEIGDTIKLAGFELSKHTSNSPFHFQGDIVRIPNSVVVKDAEVSSEDIYSVLVIVFYLTILYFAI
jgi:hypothetical protein